MLIFFVRSKYFSKAQFELDGSINKQSYRCWAAGNPTELHLKPHYRASLDVWCGVSKVRIVGSCLLIRRCSVNSEFRTLSNYAGRNVWQLRFEDFDISHGRHMVSTTWSHSPLDYASMAVVREILPQHLSLFLYFTFRRFPHTCTLTRSVGL